MICIWLSALTHQCTQYTRYVKDTPSVETLVDGNINHYVLTLMKPKPKPMKLIWIFDIHLDIQIGYLIWGQLKAHVTHYFPVMLWSFNNVVQDMYRHGILFSYSYQKSMSHPTYYICRMFFLMLFLFVLCLLMVAELLLCLLHMIALLLQIYRSCHRYT